MTITACDLKHSHPPTAVARQQLHILYLPSISKKQGPSLNSFVSLNSFDIQATAIYRRDCYLPNLIYQEIRHLI